MGSIFDQDRCGIPAIEPIADLPFIDDCSVPAAPAAIEDCPDVDIPLPGPAGGPGGPGPDGPRGPAGRPGADGAEIYGLPGNDGADGQDGCEPTVTADSTVVYVDDPSEVSVDLVVTNPSFCTYHLQFTFYLYQQPDDGCSYWVWCCDPGYVPNPCCLGSWKLRSGPGGTEPCSVGCCHGQVRILCPGCPSSSSSSSQQSSSQYACTTCESGTAPLAFAVEFDGPFGPAGGYDGECDPAICGPYWESFSFMLYPIAMPPNECYDEHTTRCIYRGVFSMGCGDYVMILRTADFWDPYGLYRYALQMNSGVIGEDGCEFTNDNVAPYDGVLWLDFWEPPDETFVPDCSEVTVIPAPTFARSDLCDWTACQVTLTPVN